MAKHGGAGTTATPQSRRPSMAMQVQTITASQQQQLELQQPPTQPLEEDSMANLRKLSDSISAFQRCFTELQHHIDSIRTSINSFLPPITTITTNPIPYPSPPAAPAPVPVPVAKPEPEPELSLESDPSEDEELEEEEAEEEAEVEVKQEEEEERQEEEVKSPEVKSSAHSELENLCESMCSRSLRKYMIGHLSNIGKLCEQVPKALKHAPSPARLVLECCGKFFYQGRKAYAKGSPNAIKGRNASALILECFLLMGIDRVESVKEEAYKSAIGWRKRMLSEGGILKAQEIDARGLLLFVGCFGIPSQFRNVDIMDLLQVSFIKRVSHALRRSNVLKAKIPEIIEGMVKQKMEVSAAHIAYTFGIEDRFNPQKLLTSFLQESTESMKKMMEQSQGSLAAVNEAKRKYLSALRSVMKCLGLHNIDPSELLRGWRISEKIMSLEKEIHIGERISYKRKIDETESSRRFRRKEAKNAHFPNPRLEKERVVNHGDSSSTLLDDASAGHIYGYSVSPSVLYGPIAGSIHENVVGSLAGTVRGVPMSGVGTGISAAGTEVVPLAGSYAGGHGGTLADSKPGQVGGHTGQSYGWRGDAAVHDRLASHSYAYRPSLYLEGSTGLPNTVPGDAYRPPPYLQGCTGLPNTIAVDTYNPPPYVRGSTGLPNTQPSDAHRPPPYSESSTGLQTTQPSDAYRPPPHMEGSTRLQNTQPSDAYRPPPYLEGSTGLPNTIPSDVARQSSASDIYQANTVTANELFRSSGSRAADAVPSAHPSYWPR